MGLDWLAGRMFALGSPAFVLTKVAIDLAIFGSLHVIGFFAYLTLAEGGSWQVGRGWRQFGCSTRCGTVP